MLKNVRLVRHPFFTSTTFYHQIKLLILKNQLNYLIIIDETKKTERLPHMKNKNIGCFGWIIIMIFLIWLIGLIIEYWKIFLLIMSLWIALIIFQNYQTSKSISSNKTHCSPSNQVKHSTEVNHVSHQRSTHNSGTKPSLSHKYIPDPVNYDDVMHYLKKDPPVVIKDNGEYINGQTGKPMSNPQSIQQTCDKILHFDHQTDSFKHCLEIAHSKNSQEAVNMYLAIISTPYYEGARLAYQRGDYKQAENFLLKIIDIQPLIVSNRLANIFRREHRYKDMVDIYRAVLNRAQRPFAIVRLSSQNQQIIIEARNKAGELLISHLNNDQSKGFNTRSSIVDIKFIQELNHKIC